MKNIAFAVSNVSQKLRFQPVLFADIPETLRHYIYIILILGNTISGVYKCLTFYLFTVSPRFSTLRRHRRWWGQGEGKAKKIQKNAGRK